MTKAAPALDQTKLKQRDQSNCVDAIIGYERSFKTSCGVELAVANTLVPACVRI
jgi:hypothetical protein